MKLFIGAFVFSVGAVNRGGAHAPSFGYFIMGGFGGFRFFGCGIPYSGKTKLKTLKIIII